MTNKKIQFNPFIVGAIQINSSSLRPVDRSNLVQKQSVLILIDRIFFGRKKLSKEKSENKSEASEIFL